MSVGIPRTCHVVRREVDDIGSGNNPLDSFFPFDPFLLQDSSKFIAPIYVNWSDVVGEDSDDDDDDAPSSESLSDSLLSSLSMSVESHVSASSPPIGKMDSQRQRTLSISLLYEEGNAENTDTHLFESNPLSYNDEDSDDNDFQKLSFTRTRKMSDAGGW